MAVFFSTTVNPEIEQPPELEQPPEIEQPPGVFYKGEN
jgi:hypothetical protein